MLEDAASRNPARASVLRRGSGLYARHPVPLGSVP